MRRVAAAPTLVNSIGHGVEESGVAVDLGALTARPCQV
jgi:hypothetical protein